MSTILTIAISYHTNGFLIGKRINRPKKNRRLAFCFSATYLARFKYVPSAVLISNNSSASTKSGTLTTNPVSIVAGLPEPVTVAPLIEGCVSATRKITVVGKVKPMTSSP